MLYQTRNRTAKARDILRLPTEYELEHVYDGSPNAGYKVVEPSAHINLRALYLRRVENEPRITNSAC